MQQRRFYIAKLRPLPISRQGAEPMSVLFYALMRFAPKGLLHGQHIGKCLNGGACLAKVAHLLVDTQFDMRDTCIV